MVFLGIRYPSPVSRRVATDLRRRAGFQLRRGTRGRLSFLPTRAPPKPASSRGAEPRGGFRLFSLPYATDSTFVRVGAGAGDFARAKRVMERWGHFQLGWSEVDPDTGVAPGDPVCVCANILGVWIRNPLKVVYNESGGGGGGGEGRRRTRDGTLHLCARMPRRTPPRRRGGACPRAPRRRQRVVRRQHLLQPAHPLALVGYPPCARCSGNSRRIPRARFEKGCATRKRRSLSRETSGGGDEDEDGDGDEDEDQSASVRRFQARRKPSRWPPHAPADPEAWKLAHSI